MGGSPNSKLRGVTRGKYGGDLVQLYGSVSERLMELVLKTRGGGSRPWVQILPLPPIHSEPNLARASSRAPQGKCNSGNEYSRTGSLLTLLLILLKKYDIIYM